MGKLRKLTAERRWALSQWERCGWSIPRIGFEAKKWRAHIAALVMMGLLEEISGGGLMMDSLQMKNREVQEKYKIHSWTVKKYKRQAIEALTPGSPL